MALWRCGVVALYSIFLRSTLCERKTCSASESAPTRFEMENCNEINCGPEVVAL